MPELKIGIASIFNKTYEFAIGYQLARDLKIIEMYLVCTKFIVKTKTFTLMAHGVDAFRDFNIFSSYVLFDQAIGTAIDRESGLVAKNIFYVI